MPIHDWTRVPAGIFHHFHVEWMAALNKALNAGTLPGRYYSLSAQVAADLGPDLLTLQMDAAIEETITHAESLSSPTTAIPEPRVRFAAATEMDQYVLKQDTLVILHGTGDRVVSLVEILSEGNKSSRHAMRRLVEKALAALYRGYHLLIIDLYPPGPRDRQGIHGEIWQEIADDSFRLPADKPLTLAAYSAGLTKRAYIEPVAVGDPLPDMPLFLRPGFHVAVPLEETYQTAWINVPQRWRQVLENGTT